MAHMPVSHHLQPLYRVLAGVCGLYVLLFGLIGWAQTAGDDLFGQDGLPSVLGLRANLASSILSVLAGVILLVGAFIGRDLGRWINLIAGLAALVVGLAMMALMQTDLNILGFTIATCIVAFIIGMVLFTAGLYGRTGSQRQRLREERFRHGAPDPQGHPWNADAEADRSQPTPGRFA